MTREKRQEKKMIGTTSGPLGRIRFAAKIDEYRKEKKKNEEKKKEKGSRRCTVYKDKIMYMKIRKKKNSRGSLNCFLGK